MRGDFDLLLRALLNALDRALEAEPLGKVTIAAGRAGERVDVSVVDHGDGIPADDRARLLEPFGGVDGRRKPDAAGLGLTVARGLVETAGGLLTLDETPGGGLTLVISLPLGEPIQTRPQAAAHS